MLPSGVWSTLMTLSICSRPSIASWAPGVTCARCKACAAAFQRMSSTSELLPEPLTPVTAVTTPSGKRDVDVPEVVLPRPVTRSQGRPARRRPAGGWSAPGSRPCRSGTGRSATSVDRLDLRRRARPP